MWECNLKEKYNMTHIDSILSYKGAEFYTNHGGGGGVVVCTHVQSQKSEKKKDCF